jgi:hypothetical protein
MGIDSASANQIYGGSGDDGLRPRGKAFSGLRALAGMAVPT